MGIKPLHVTKMGQLFQPDSFYKEKLVIPAA